MTLYRFHGRITVEREESLSHLLYERMSIMYKVELKFDTSKLAPETVNQMCEQADQIFEQEDLSCAVKALGSRILGVIASLFIESRTMEDSGQQSFS